MKLSLRNLVKVELTKSLLKFHVKGRGRGETYTHIHNGAGPQFV